ncbi:cholesterol 24-hydroxylase-like [Halichondria panicea]|uniref:cholesterol 24-hydroxylase-like n=1 Tax=Halichondria panicea TaxID=6063 RepID=UPI00312B447D
MGALLVLVYLIGGVLSLVAGSFLCFMGYIYYIRHSYSHLPSPKLHKSLKGYIYGHLYHLIEMRKSSMETSVVELFTKWCLELDSPSAFVIFFLHVPIVVPSHPETIKTVTMQVKNGKIKQLKTRVGWLFGQRFLGNGLVAIFDYDTWKPRRKIYDQPFNKNYLKSLLPSFNECTDKLLEGIRPLADGKTTVPMKQHLSEVTLNVISKVAFGSDFSGKWDATLGLKWVKGNGKLTFLISHAFEGLQKSFDGGLAYAYLHPFEVRGYKEAIRALRMIGRDCVMKRIRAVEAGEQIPRDILSSILQVASTKESVDIEDLVDDFVTFYIAGQETTGNLLSIATVLIHQHPDVMCRLQAEVEEVLEGRTEVTNEDLEKLQYTEQVLLEVLRLYPPVTGVSKQAMEGGIQLGEYFISGGTFLFLQMSMMSRLPQYFDDPDSFNPARFNPENKQPSSFVYFPFSLGHRSCIGKQFALMEAKLILARLVQTFRFTLPPDYKLVVVQKTTLQPKDDVPCTVTPTSIS